MGQVAIRNTTRFPFSTAVSIYVRWSDGSRTRGSGVMVGPNDVLTAAHVVFADPATGRGRPVNITVIPAQNGMNAPSASSEQ